MAEFLKMTGICKVYPNGTVANDNVDFSLNEGEIHAIAGENGAGKSTIMKILFGAEKPTAGKIFFCGEEVSIDSPKTACALGIGMVYQHFMLVNELPVYQNVFLGIELKNSFGVLKKQEMIDRTRALAEKYDMPVDPMALCSQIPVGMAQKVEILKVIAKGAKLIILDEPTAVLTPQETQQLFMQLRSLRDNGHTIVIITHKLREIKELCDRVTIMRGGRNMGVHNVCDVTEEEISTLMVGSSVQLKVEKAPAVPGEVAVSFNNVTLPGSGRNALDNISFTARRGKILCLAGVEGNGQQQVVDCLTAVRRNYSGEICVMGTDIRGKNIQKVRALGLSHIPEDRMCTGTDQSATIYENLLSLSYKDNCTLGLMNTRALSRKGEEQIENYLIKGSLSTPLSALSGGNMQKVVLARELDGDPCVVVADQPTRGVDVGAIEFIHKKLVSLRDAGCCIVLVSADMSEVFALADEIIVFHQGEISAKITDVANLTEQQLGRYMLGLEKMEGCAK